MVRVFTNHLSSLFRFVGTRTEAAGYRDPRNGEVIWGFVFPLNPAGRKGWKR
jgi:hypothetical protein